MSRTAKSFRDIDDRMDDLRDLADEYPSIWGDFMRRFELSWIYHENALEGIVLTHAELDSALKGRPIAPDTYLGIRNFKLGMDLIRREASDNTKVDMAFVRKVHAVLGSDQPDFQAAKYRKDIPLHRTYFHDIAQPNVIPNRVGKLLDWAAENEPDDDDAIRYAAHFHHEFMSVFPFTHYTGKTGRLILNHMLLSHGYLPIVFHATERQRYYDTLRLTKKHMEQLIVDTMGNCVENASKFIQRTLEEQEKQKVRQLFAAS